MKLPNFALPLYGIGEHNTIFLILNLDTVLSESTPQNFANIWQIKWNWIRTEAFSPLFRFVIIQKFCYNGNVTQRLLLSIVQKIRKITRSFLTDLNTLAYSSQISASRPWFGKITLSQILWHSVMFLMWNAYHWKQRKPMKKRETALEQWT